jgi:hypothetical protein
MAFFLDTEFAVDDDEGSFSKPIQAKFVINQIYRFPFPYSRITRITVESIECNCSFIAAAETLAVCCNWNAG